MNMSKKLYRLIFNYHLNMIELCNIRQSLGLISDDKAEEANKKHCMRCIKAAYFGGFASDQVKELF